MGTLKPKLDRLHLAVEDDSLQSEIYKLTYRRARGAKAAFMWQNAAQIEANHIKYGVLEEVTHFTKKIWVRANSGFPRLPNMNLRSNFWLASPG